MAKPVMSSEDIELEEITPAQYRCAVGECPSVFKASNGNLFIVGKLVSPDVTAGPLKGRIGQDETVIEISADLIAGAMQDCQAK